VGKKSSLTLNRTNTKEIVFVDTKRKHQVTTPPTFSGIDKVTSLKILSVTMINGLSASDHIRHIISDCAQTLYALRVLQAHGMNDTALHAIYKSVVVAKLLYVSSAWAGFITAADRQRVNAFLRRSIRCGFCPSDISMFDQLIKVSNEQLFGTCAWHVPRFSKSF